VRKPKERERERRESWEKWEKRERNGDLKPEIAASRMESETTNPRQVFYLLDIDLM